MARRAIQDVLTNYPFWLMDVAPIELLGLPVLSPEFGFSAITAPELTLNVEEIPEGNWYFSRKVVKDATVGQITLSRGATFADSDFYRWIRVAMTGNTENYQSQGYNSAMLLQRGGAAAGGGSGLNIASSVIGAVAGLFGIPRIGGPSPRRDLVLIQFFAHGPGDDILSAVIGHTIMTAATALQSVTAFAPSLVSIGTPGKMSRVPARAWKLKGCIPVRYKSGTDFDALGIAVSIMELDIEVESMVEMSMSSL